MWGIFYTASVLTWWWRFYDVIFIVNFINSLVVIFDFPYVFFRRWFKRCDSWKWRIYHHLIVKRNILWHRYEFLNTVKQTVCSVLHFQVTFSPFCCSNIGKGHAFILFLTIEFFTICVSVRLSDRSLHREEQKKIHQKFPPVGIETRTSRPSGQCLTNWARQESVGLEISEVSLICFMQLHMLDFVHF